MDNLTISDPSLTEIQASTLSLGKTSETSLENDSPESTEIQPSTLELPKPENPLSISCPEFTELQHSTIRLKSASPRPENVPLAPSTNSNLKLTSISKNLEKVVNELLLLKDISKCRPQYQYCLKIVFACLQQSTNSEKRLNQKIINQNNLTLNLRNRLQKAQDTIQNDRSKIVSLKSDVHSMRMDIICCKLKEKNDESRIKTLEVEKDSLNSKIEEQHCNILSLEAQNEQHEVYREATNKELLEAYRKNSGASYQVDKLQNDYAKIQDTVFSLRDELSKCKDLLAEEKRNKDLLNYELEKTGGNYRNEVINLNSELSDLKSKYKDLQNNFEDTRYQLESMEAHNEVLQEFFESTQNKYQLEQQETQSLAGDFDKKNRELNETAEKLEFIQKEATELKRLQMQVRAQVDELELEKEKFILEQNDMKNRIKELEIDNKECLKEAENAQIMFERVIDERDETRQDLLRIRNKYYELSDERDYLRRENEVLEHVKTFGMSDAEQQAAKLAVAAAEAAKQAAEAAKQAMEAAQAAREAEQQRRILAEERADELRKAELEKIKHEIEAEAEIRRQEKEQQLKDEEMLEIMKKRAAEEAQREKEQTEKLRRELDESLNLVRQGGVGGDSSLPSENGLPDGDSVLEKKDLGEGNAEQNKKTTERRGIFNRFLFKRNQKEMKK